MDTKKTKKKSSTNHEKKEKRKNERKTWNLEDGVAMQDPDDDEVIVVKRNLAAAAEEEDDKENHRTSGSDSSSRCLLKKRVSPQRKSTWSTTPKEEAMVQDWVSQLYHWISQHGQPDMGDLIHLLMCEGEEGYEDLRLKLDGCKPDVRERFFNIIVEETEPAVEAIETSFHYESRVRDMGRELCASYESYRRRPFTVNEKHRAANDARRTQDHRLAFLASCDWVFAAASTIHVPVMIQIEEYTSGETMGDAQYQTLPPKFAFFDAKVSQVEALFLNRQYKKASVYGFHTIDWMARCKESGVTGFYATFYPERYALLQTWVSESEVKLGDFTRALMLSSKAIERHSTLETTVTVEKSLFRSRQTLFEHLVDHFESSHGDDENQIDLDRGDARIRVSPWEKHGYVDGQFVVNDLQTALTMAKDGDLIFLEEGTFKPNPPAKGKGGRGKFEVTKSLQIVGASTSDSVISGSLVKRGPGEVTFSRLRLVIGATSNSQDEAHFMGGRTTFRHCVIESPVNTAMHVVNVAPDKEGTFLFFQVCILNGLESCHKLITFKGPRPRILLQSCYVMDAFSLITVKFKAKDVPSYCHIQIVDTVLYDLQDGLKIALPVLSRSAIVEIVRSHIELFPRDNDRPGQAFSQVGGKAMLSYNYVHNTYLDANGFSLHAMKSVRLIRNLVETPSEQSRAFAIAEGFYLSEVEHATLDGLQVDGMRIGFNIANEEDHLNTYLVKDCTAKNCALGMMVRALSPQPIVMSASLAEDSEDFSSQKNLDINLVGCQFDMCHFGVLVQDKRCSLALMSTWFYDVPKPIILKKHALSRFELRNNTYKYYTEKLVGPLDEEVSSDDQGEKDKVPVSEQCEDLISRATSGDVEAKTQVLETLKSIEKETKTPDETCRELLNNLSGRSSSNDNPKSSSSQTDKTSKKETPKADRKQMKNAGDCKDKKSKTDSGYDAEKSQQAPKYVTDAVKKALAMSDDVDSQVNCVTFVPNMSKNEPASMVVGPKTRKKKNHKTSPPEPITEEGKVGIDSKKTKKSQTNELTSKARNCQSVPKSSSSSSENKETSEEGTQKAKAKQIVNDMEVEQESGDPKCGKCCTAANANAIIVSLPLPAPRAPRSTEEILRTLSPSITVSRSRSASNPSSPVNPSAGPSPDKGYLDAVSELQSRLRKVKLEQEEENKSQQPVAELASSSVAEAVRAAVKARRGAAPVIPHLSACESVPHVNNADAIEDLPDGMYIPTPKLQVEPDDEEMQVTPCHAEKRAKDMFLFFGMKENLPQRVSVDEEDSYITIYQKRDEFQLMSRFKRSRKID